MKTLADNQPTVAKLKYTQTKETGNFRIRATVQLADDYKNGHEDFSVTGETWKKASNGRWMEGSCGCIHKHFPNLRQFIPLHLSTWQGIPMYGVENGFYWFTGLFADGLGNKHHPGTGSRAITPEQCRAILLEHLRCNDDELNAIIESGPRTKEEFSHVLETMGFRARWKKEAGEAIKKLEALTGAKFGAVGPKQTWKPLDAAQIADIKARQESGYYTPEAVKARGEANKAARKEKAILEVEEDHKKSLAKLENKRLVSLFKVELCGSQHGGNIIWYDHTNELCFNWTSTDKLWTREEFEEVTRTADMSKLPPGLVWKFQDKPRF